MHRPQYDETFVLPMAVSNRAVYPTQPRPLRDQITSLLRKADQPDVPKTITAIVVPDTNEVEAGLAAGTVYASLSGRKYESVLVVSPSHSGEFGRISIANVDTYRTALGELNVNDQIRNELCDEDDDIFVDDRGHFHTEGIDVQLPFLQMVLDGTFDVVPIVMGDESPDFCRELGIAIGEVAYSRRILIVASADILSGSEAALDSFKNHFEHGDVSRLMSLVNSNQIRIEGKGPILVALIAALHQGADDIRVVSIKAPESDSSGHIGAILGR